MFKKILIANRGEIAVRVIKTAKKMGISTVAVYSSVDSEALFVNLADESYLLGGPQALDSYLNINKIIDIAKKTKVDAIHPGYGFLSENSEFAKACEQSGLVFIGPDSKTIELMGSKAAAKKAMSEAKVPLIPGYHGSNQTTEHLYDEAKKIGFPILIKPSFGGGGKGMRVISNPKDFADGLESCKREAKISFGNDEVILEKYIANPRHIEVQIFADSFNNVVHLFERDCSIQRRHQKIIEEAPSSIRNEVREKICLAAVNAAKYLKYINAGTIEFLLDESENFYFMEMNTRLQVEHPVTEMITGQDLVEWQLKVANGEKLPLAQSEIKLNGYSIEARIYAEDPINNFLPTSGDIHKLILPRLTQTVRLDSGIKDKDHIGIHYDPMLAKLIVHADTRVDAINKLKKSLEQFHMIGLKTNICFLKSTLLDPNFLLGNVSTNYLDQTNYKEILDINLAFVLSVSAYYLTGAAKNFGLLKNWRLNSKNSSVISLSYNNRVFEAKIISIDNDTIEITNLSCCGKSLENEHSSIQIKYNIHDNYNISLVIEDKNYDIFIYSLENMVYTLIGNYDFNFLIPSLDLYAKDKTAEKGSLLSPMPGTITKILVENNAKVTKGQQLLVLEAMKMEHTILAPNNGIVKSINCNIGETVEQGVKLAVID